MCFCLILLQKYGHDLNVSFQNYVTFILNLQLHVHFRKHLIIIFLCTVFAIKTVSFINKNIYLLKYELTYFKLKKAS